MGDVTRHAQPSSPNGRRNRICLCGSSRFKDEHLAIMARETLLGNIVIPLGFFHHVDKVPITAEQKEALDELHFEKIEMCDEVLVVNPNGYAGESTRKEIMHAKQHGKRIRYLESLVPPLVEMETR